MTSHRLITATYRGSGQDVMRQHGTQLSRTSQLTVKFCQLTEESNILGLLYTVFLHLTHCSFS